MIVSKDFCDGGEPLHQRIDRETPFPEFLDDTILRVGNPRRLAASGDLAKRIGKEPQRARGGDLVAQRFCSALPGLQMREGPGVQAERGGAHVSPVLLRSELAR